MSEITFNSKYRKIVSMRFIGKVSAQLLLWIMLDDLVNFYHTLNSSLVLRCC